MSYDGREQHICAAGHLYESNASFYAEDMPACFCGQKSVWHNSVDDTNCDAYGYIPTPFFTMLTPEESEVCNLGHKHITKMATYQIPSQDDVPKIRHYWDDVKGAFVPISFASKSVCIKCGEPTLGKLKVCYDHAKLDPNGEPSNPAE